MKTGIDIFKLFAFFLVLIMGCTACMSRNATSGGGTSEKSSSTGSIVSDSQTSGEISVVMESSKEIEASRNSTSSSWVSESTAKSDRQIIAAIFAEREGSRGDVDSAALRIVDPMVSAAEKLPNRYLGKITSEEDAKKKAEDVWLPADDKPYKAKFYDKYGIWLIEGTFSSGIDSNGRIYATPGEAPWIAIQKSDGKVLAVF